MSYIRAALEICKSTFLDKKGNVRPCGRCLGKVRYAAAKRRQNPRTEWICTQSEPPEIAYEGYLTGNGVGRVSFEDIDLVTARPNVPESGEKEFNSLALAMLHTEMVYKTANTAKF